MTEYGVCPHCGSSDLSSNTGAEWQCVACGAEWLSPELALQKENEALRTLALTLPSKLQAAEAEGRDFFSVMIYGYEVCYSYVQDDVLHWHWAAYLNDTAD